MKLIFTRRHPFLFSPVSSASVVCGLKFNAPAGKNRISILWSFISGMKSEDCSFAATYPLNANFSDGYNLKFLFKRGYLFVKATNGC
jgi:hypothetical protein